MFGHFEIWREEKKIRDDFYFQAMVTFAERDKRRDDVLQKVRNTIRELAQKRTEHVPAWDKPFRERLQNEYENEYLIKEVYSIRPSDC